ncbi:g1503 [Coccomyxa viridis]|uniref:G1503 protein n=1 Tax=Coccomyxa viridis TaxID=1274662 RepID=A0ABP1FK93_9CHLO
MRPPGTNGMDAKYRMQVVSHYKRLPAQKRRLKLLAYANVVVWVLVTIVQTLPLWHRLKSSQLEGDGGDKLWLAAQAATGGAIWTFAVYWAGTGGNIWRDDSQWLLSLYVVCNLVVAVMAGVLLYLRKMGNELLNGKSALQSIEYLELALNLIGVSTSVAASVLAYQYLSLRKKAKGS